MNYKQGKVYQIIQSDAFGIAMASVFMFMMSLFVKVYFLMNDAPEGWLQNTYYPIVAITNIATNNFKNFWVIVLHFFIDISFLKLISNLFWLIIFGTILEKYSNKYYTWIVFVLSGISTGISTALTVYYAPQLFSTSYYIGMQLPITSLAIALIVLSGNDNFSNSPFTVFKHWHAVAAFLLLSSLSYIQNVALLPAFIVAIIIGIVAGLYIKHKATTATKIDLQQLEQDGKASVKTIGEQKLNELLDKINKNGMDSLSNTELEWLKKYNN